MLRLGLIGAGRWGKNYIRTISKSEGAYLARLVSRNPESVSLVEKNCRVTSDWRELIAAGDLDGLVLAVPPRIQPEIIDAAIKVRLPVLVEKPLALAATTAHQILAAAKDRSLVMVDHTHVYSPAFIGLCTEQKKMGKILAIESRAGAYGPFRKDTPVLWDWGPHDVAMSIALMGEAPSSALIKSHTNAQQDSLVGESLEIALRWTSGVIADLKLSNVVERCREFRVISERGTLVYDDTKAEKLLKYSTIELDSQALDGEPIPYPEQMPLSRVIDEFVSAIQQGALYHPSLELGMKVVETLELCCRS